MGEGGEVHGSELDAELVANHARLFADHPYRRRITLWHGNGEAILRGLPGNFDLVFIDLYKTAHPRVLATAVERVRVGGWSWPTMCCGAVASLIRRRRTIAAPRRCGS